ncbi:MAG: aspartate--tRNA(Asn) ligase [Spirochaetaceae bacterium]|jgi:nondiscriminating aspartyl-tRNA synthetase|nr:aspartate--tRNA(Asn) ligase [Spirochaetaceae bacterium]
MRTLAKEIAAAAKERPDDILELKGWVHRIRDMGGVNFVILRDRSGLVQLVFNEKPLDEAGNPLTLESAIVVQGKAALNPKAPGGAEVQVVSTGSSTEGLTILNKAHGDLPFQVNGDMTKMGLESILDNRALSVRNPKIRSIFHVQSTIIEAFSSYLRSQDFTEIKTTKLVGGGTEGGTNLFAVDYFDRKVYLAQSPQLYKQIMVASGLERVFEVAPAFRAEKHDTPRHLNEYISLDVEMGFIDSEQDLIKLERGLLAYIFEQVASKNAEDVAAWGATVPKPESTEAAPIISYEEAVKIANAEEAKAKKGGASRIFDITPEAERLLCQWSMDNYGSELIFVNEFPRKYRPFYTYPLDKGEGQPQSTMSFDALFRGLEITTGGRRQHNYEEQLEALPKFGLTPDGLSGLLTILKYGAPPHGGFAIGAERLTQKILGLASVKEASLFPRDRKRVEP